MCILSAVVFAMVTGGSGTISDDADRGLVAVNAAIDAVQGDGDECRFAALSKLKSARDVLESVRIRQSPDVFPTAMRSVENAVDASGRVCGAESTAALRGAFELLEITVDRLAGEQGALAQAVSRRKQALSCWDYRNDFTQVDPGCFLRKDGHAPLGREAFARVLQGLRTAGGPSDQARFIERVLGSHAAAYITARQLAELIALVPRDSDRGAMVRNLAERLVDPQNAPVVARHITDDAARQNALEALAEQHRSASPE